MRGLRVLVPLRTAIISTIEPFFTAVLGAWLLSQPMTSATLLGGCSMTQAELLRHLVDVLESVGADYMIGGSHAAM